MNMEFEVTKLGERGQIVIPMVFRDNLRLEKGEKFMVTEAGGALILKRLKPVTDKEFNELLRKTHKHAEKHSLKEKDMWNAIKKTRKKKE